MTSTREIALKTLNEEREEARLQKRVKKEEDAVNNLLHYKLFPDLEVIEAIRKMLTLREYRGYLKGNILEYRLRAGKKGSPEITIEDIKKSMKYEEFLRELESETLPIEDNTND